MGRNYQRFRRPYWHTLLCTVSLYAISTASFAFHGLWRSRCTELISSIYFINLVSAPSIGSMSSNYKTIKNLRSIQGAWGERSIICYSILGHVRVMAVAIKYFTRGQKKLYKTDSGKVGPTKCFFRLHVPSSTLPTHWMTSDATIELKLWIHQKYRTIRVKVSSVVEWLLLVMHAGHANQGYTSHTSWTPSNLVLLAIWFRID